jgi:4-phospho-D-threonate 3-dehydrogenase / 4-phospho-D-erythronate 3-dehydrogenase
MGDPAGIGAEICVKALMREEPYSVSRPVVVGDLAVLKTAAALLGANPAWHCIRDPQEGRFEHGSIDVIDLANVRTPQLRWGHVSAAAGQAAYEYVIHATELVLNRHADAIVTAPIHKEALNLAGHPYAGHTELLAEQTDTRSYTMMLVVGRLRVAHVTGHMALRRACEQISTARVLEVIVLTDEAMRRIGIAHPRIAVAALNPHGGEAGLFGREEIEQILPAIDTARRRGLSVEGPLPSDTMMAKSASGGYDAAVAMYHDQGHIAVKFVGFSYDRHAREWSSVRGVNITLGLPIIRTSVDHGTAFDIAGKGIASELSMLDAIDWAVALAGGDSSRVRGDIAPQG